MTSCLSARKCWCLNGTFPFHQKDNWVFFWTFFFPSTNLFLTFVVFACFATTRVNMRFRANSAQGYIQCMKCIGGPVVRTDGRTDVRTDGHVTIKSLPKCFGLTGYQISLAMELRWRASALAPLIYNSNLSPCRRLVVSEDLISNNRLDLIKSVEDPVT